MPHTLVSIHAPARGATIAKCVALRELRSFNPRARAGRDIMAMQGRTLVSTFQSTRPRGARHAVMRLYVGFCTCFNPRARAGRDIQ